MNTENRKKEDEVCFGKESNTEYTKSQLILQNDAMRAAITRLKSENISFAAQVDFHKSRAERFNEEAIFRFNESAMTEKKNKELNKTIQILMGAIISLSMSLFVVFIYYQTI